ncbi:hypothetical protein F3087_41655 [Nocardia colli]|uniref:Uncharacterized protein n=1 Tax=Nocardia colli TaxID=2545717 RepID=A0A5N0DVK1_9NOCA|nr:hypothetical protein [Nocardia colli]KAA8880380.1 hypothetical protein F3087_41655 [Nocardia colli]
MSRVPSNEQWLAAIENRLAHLMCFEAIGYARGYCDAAGIGSADAIDFGRAYAVLVAADTSRPSIAGAWRNWQADLDLATIPGGDETTSRRPHRRSETGSAGT